MEIWLDLAGTKKERESMAVALERRGQGGAIVVTATDRPGPGMLNVNDDLFAEDSIAAQRAVVRAYEECLDAAGATHPTLSDVLDGIRVPLYEHNVYEVVKWIVALARAMRDVPPADLVVYVPAHPSDPAPFLYEAEGEASTHPLAAVLYRRTDFLTAVLVAHLRRLGVTQFRTFQLRPNRPWERRVRQNLRVYGVLVLKGLWHVSNRLRHRALPVPEGLASRVVAVSRSSVHTDYLSSALTAVNASLVVFESERTYPSHLRASRQLLHSTTVPVVHGFDLIGVGTIASRWLRVCGRLLAEDLWRRRDVRVDVPGVALSFSLRQGIREGIVQTFESQLLSEVLCRGGIKAPKVRKLLHCEMMTHYASALAHTARRAGVACYQVAFGTYKPKPTPAFVPGDGFLCFSQEQLDGWAAASERPQRLLYEGNFLLSTATPALPEVERHTRRMVAFFSQPYARDQELQLVKALQRICVANGRELLVVLHPRDPESKFAGIEVRVVRNAEYLARRAELEDSLFLAATRVSNIVYQLVLRRVPCVNLLVSASDALVVQEYYAWGAPLFYSVAEFEAAMAEPEALIRRCSAFADRYVGGCFANRGVEAVAGWLMR